MSRVALEGFRLFHDALSGALERAARSGGEPLEEMGRAYVRFALQNPSHYQTMFGGYLTGWEKYPDLASRAQDTFMLLVDTVRGEQRREKMVSGDPVELAEIIWSLSHGIATLGAAGQLGRTGTAIEELALTGCRALRRGLERPTTAPPRKR